MLDSLHTPVLWFDVGFWHKKLMILFVDKKYSDTIVTFYNMLKVEFYNSKENTKCWMTNLEC